jgi:hypothetical protein
LSHFLSRHVPYRNMFPISEKSQFATHVDVHRTKINVFITVTHFLNHPIFLRMC